jgi:hypothetical protein
MDTGTDAPPPWSCFSDQERLAAARERVARRVGGSDGGAPARHPPAVGGRRPHVRPRRNLSEAGKAFAPAVATDGQSGFAVARHEERRWALGPLHDVSLEADRGRQKFLLFRAGDLEPVQGCHRVIGEDLPVVLADLEALV